MSRSMQALNVKKAADIMQALKVLHAADVRQATKVNLAAVVRMASKLKHAASEATPSLLTGEQINFYIIKCWLLPLYIVKSVTTRA